MRKPHEMRDKKSFGLTLWGMVLAVALAIAALSPASVSRADMQMPSKQTGAANRPAGFLSLRMVNRDVGWALYGKPPYEWVLRTQDGGRTWENITPSGATTRGGLLGVFPDANNAWIVYYPYELQTDSLLAITHNAGRSWSYQVLPGTLATGSQAFSVVSEQDAFIVLSGRLYETEDGGNTWHPVGPAKGTQLAFRSAEEGWMIAKRPKQQVVMHTQDGGRAWQQLQAKILT